jgi:hypothetical protein
MTVPMSISEDFSVGQFTANLSTTQVACHFFSTCVIANELIHLTRYERILACRNISSPGRIKLNNTDIESHDFLQIYPHAPLRPGDRVSAMIRLFCLELSG